MAKATLKTIEQNDNVGMFSTCFNTRTYQEDSKLSGYVMDLQTFDKVLLKAQKSGKVTIEKNMITDIQSATFEI